MRIVGYLGIMALVLFNIFGFVLAFQQRDIRGIGLMLFMTLLLAVFASTLWRGARIERGFSGQRLAEGWSGESVTSFFANVVMRTLAGRVFLAGTLASELAAVLSMLWPAAIGIAPARASVTATMFAVWPVLSFVWFVKLSVTRDEPRLVGILTTLAIVLFPFYLVYMRNSA